MSRFDTEHPSKALIKLARFLITEADSKGLTHGEKHYMMQAALFLLHKAQDSVSENAPSIFERHEVSQIEASDIPF